MKKTLLVLCIFMILAVNIYAGGGLYSGGSGTAADPYQITTELDLYNVRNNLSSYFILMNDIDLGEGEYYADPGWTPFPQFKGNFNGNGHIINNLRTTLKVGSGSAFFGNLSGATVTKLGITNADVTGCQSAGILTVVAQNSTIDQCWTSGKVHAAMPPGYPGNSYAGGLVGAAFGGTVSNCYSVANVITDKNGYNGGLVAVLRSAVIVNCYASGPLTFSTGWKGGLVADDWEPFNSTVTNCFWNTETQGATRSFGGTGITSEAMKDPSTFWNAGWSNTIWDLDADVNASGFPYLLCKNIANTPPGAPVAIAASSVTQTSFNANWNSTSGATGYYLDVATDNGVTSILPNFSNKDVANVTTFAVTGLTVGTPYYYRVRAYNTIGTGGNSNTITQTTIPDVPVSVAAGSVVETSFIANWNTAIGATGYYLDVATDNTFNSILPNYSNKDVSNVTTYSVSSLNSLTTYYYRVRGYNAGGASASSNTITATTLPAAPVTIAATTIGNSSFSANWNASARASGYYLDVATDANFSSILAAFSNKDVLNVTTFSVTGLTAGITYYYRVRAYSTGGATVSSNSNTITVSTVPPVPVAIAATSITQTTFSANWNASTGATKYYLDVATDNLFNTILLNYSNKDVGNVTTYAVTGLTAATPYYYRVRAYNTSGVSTNSNIITTTTSPLGPIAPVAITATLVGSSSFSANWNASVEATKYYLDVATDNLFASMVNGFSNLDVGNVTTFSVTGLTEGNSYYYRVRSYNAIGTSDNSNTITLATLPNTPVAIAASSIFTTSFSANWNAATGASGYYLDVATDKNFNSKIAGFSNKDVLNVTTFSVTGLSNGIIYYYRVRAYNTVGETESSNSNTIDVTTALPVPVATAATLITQTTFSANWNASIGATKYFLDVATNINFTAIVTGFSNKDVGNVTTFSITGLTVGTPYYYRVRAYSSDGTSENSNTITTGTLVNITASAGPNGTVTPSGSVGTASGGNQSFVISGNAGYRVADVLVDGNSVGVVRSYTFANITSNHTISATFTPELQPTNPNFISLSSSSYSVSFSPSLDGGSYLVVRKTGSDPAFVPIDGTVYNMGTIQNYDGEEIVFDGAGTTFIETNRIVDVDYYYAVYNYHGPDYSTSHPLKAINKIHDLNATSIAVVASSNVVSSQFPSSGVSVIFTNGTGGTTLTVTKDNTGNTGNFSAQGGLSFTVTSTNPAPGSYTIILDFSSLGLTNWDNFKVYKRHDEASPWEDVTLPPLNAVITNRVTDGVPGKFTITGLSSFSQFAGAAVMGGIFQSINIINPTHDEHFQAGANFYIRWGGFLSGSLVKIEYTTDDCKTWQNILPAILADQPLVAVIEYPWKVPAGINSTKCRIRVSSWFHPTIFGISELFTIWDVSLVTPSENQKLYSGTSKEIRWNGEVLGGAEVKFSSDGGYNWNEVGQTSDKNVNKVDWIVPDITAEYCQVMIKSKLDPRISIMNVKPFTVDRMLGDVNGSGSVEVMDANQVLKKVVGLIELNKRDSKSADVDIDDYVGATDAYKIMYKVVNGEFPSLAKLNKASFPTATALVNREGKVPGVMTLPVNVNNGSGIHSIELELQVNNNAINLEDVVSKLPEGWMLYKSVVNGQIKIAATGLSELSDGTVMTLTLKLKDQSAKVPLIGTITLNGEIKNSINAKLEALPTEFTLSQNYPNPFNPATRISYALPKDSRVRIVVYNILGEKIADLLEGSVKAAGNYMLEWNATNYSSGVYIYQMTAMPLDGDKAFTKTIKMMLMK